jgi:hypothetical protein
MPPPLSSVPSGGMSATVSFREGAASTPMSGRGRFRLKSFLRFTMHGRDMADVQTLGRARRAFDQKAWADSYRTYRAIRSPLLSPDTRS